MSKVVNVRDFGAVGNGESHPLSERFADFGDAQAVYPHATNLDNEIDWAAIQAAINTVSSFGGLVFIPPGTFYIDSSLTASDLFLHGADKHKSVIKTIRSIPMIELTDSSVSTLENLTFHNTASYLDMVSVGKSTSRPDIANTHNIIRVVKGANNFSITKCILDGGYSGLRPNFNSSKWTIVECEFRNQKFAGIMSGARQVLITNCHFHNIGEDTSDDTFQRNGHGHHTHAIYVNALNNQNLTNVIITNNTFEDNVGSAIALGTGSMNAVMENISINNNVFARNAKYANLHPENSTPPREDIIIGTTSRANNDSVVSKVNISNNIFAEPVSTPPKYSNGDWDRKAAIRAIGNCKEIVVSGNIARGYNQFVVLHDGNNNYGVRSFLITDNAAYLNRENISNPSIGRAVYYFCRNGNGIDVCHNHFSNAAGNGIMIRGRNICPCKIHGNTLLNCGINHKDAFASIHLLKACEVDIEHNLIVGGTGDGIRLGSDCADNLIRDNTLRNIHRYGIRLDHVSSHNVVLHNYFRGITTHISNEGVSNEIIDCLSDRKRCLLILHSLRCNDAQENKDEPYLVVNGERKWGAEGVRSGQTLNIGDHEVPFGSYAQIGLWESDGTISDRRGEFTVDCSNYEPGEESDKLKHVFRADTGIVGDASYTLTYRVRRLR